MAALTLRLPDEKHERLRQLAERRKISMNKLIEELSTVALTEFDAETRFRARVALGSQRGGSLRTSSIKPSYAAPPLFSSPTRKPPLLCNDA